MKRVNVRRLLRKHRDECRRYILGFAVYEEQPYSHDVMQAIKARQADVELIDKIFAFINDEGTK